MWYTALVSYWWYSVGHSALYELQLIQGFFIACFPLFPGPNLFRKKVSYLDLICYPPSTRCIELFLYLLIIIEHYLYMSIDFQ